METFAADRVREPWNKGKLVGPASWTLMLLAKNQDTASQQPMNTWFGSR
jgi:hypothetical protein